MFACLLFEIQLLLPYFSFCGQPRLKLAQRSAVKSGAAADHNDTQAMDMDVANYLADKLAVKTPPPASKSNQFMEVESSPDDQQLKRSLHKEFASCTGHLDTSLPVEPLEPSPAIPAEAEVPEVEMPETKLPLEPSPATEAEVPEVEMPETELPLEPSPATTPAEAEVPKVEMPETELPLDPYPAISPEAEELETQVAETEQESELPKQTTSEVQVEEKKISATSEMVEVEDDGEKTIEDLIDKEVEEEDPPPLVMRTEQWKLKPLPKPRGPRGKTAAKCKAKSKAKAKKSKGKETEPIDLEQDDDTNGGEDQKGRNVASSSRRKRCNKRKIQEPIEQDQETRSEVKETEKIIWGPISKDGAKEFVKNCGHTFPQDGVGPRKSSTPKRSEQVEEATVEEDEESSYLKSFARRVCPKSSPAREKWFAIRDIFNEVLRDYIIDDLGASAYPVEEWGQNML